MWWSERAPSLAGAALIAALAACGFAPLYGEGAPAAAMAGRVVVAGPSDGAPGFALRERLVDRLGPAEAPTHRLEIAFRLEQRGVALTQEDVTTRFDVIGVASFALMPLNGGPAALVDEAQAVTSYSAPASTTASAFATLSAERDAELRLARMLADQIVRRLALAAGDWAA